MSLNPSPAFVRIVWLSGFIKLLGLILFFMLLVRWGNPVIMKILYYIAKIIGVLLFVYGFINFVTITLSAFNVLDFDLGSYAVIWRLAFWEPIWMFGGIFYFFSIKKDANHYPANHKAL